MSRASYLITKIIPRLITNVFCSLLSFSYIDSKCKLYYPSKIRLGRSSIFEGCIFKATGAKRPNITIGRNCHFHEGAMIDSQGGQIKFGDHCSLNAYCVVYGRGGVTIGNDVRIATGTVIVAANHNFQDPDILIRKQGVSKKGILIEDDVWIGAKAIILDGVVVGKGAVIGAGSVVTGNVPPYSVVVGVPAKVVKKRK